MTPAATSLTVPSRWADLLPELLQDVSGRLHAAADFTRFGAVCTPWRQALLYLTMWPIFQPYPVTPCKHLVLCSTVDWSNSETTCNGREDFVLAKLPEDASFSGDCDTNWVVSTDGKAAWIFNLCKTTTSASLLNVLTHETIRPIPKFSDDPRFNQWMENLHGVIYQDHTIFLYSIFNHNSRRPTFTAAILHYGDTEWTFVKKKLDFQATCGGHSVAAYHDGKIVVCVDGLHRSVLKLDDGGGQNLMLQSWSDNSQEHKILVVQDCFYVLESHSELLWVSVHVKQYHRKTENYLADELSLMVHTLKEEADESGNMRWVAMDAQRLADCVLFLGFPASFAMNATQLDMDGGCAYFVLMGGLFRYSFIDGETKLVKRLHPIWRLNKTCVWLQPKPYIAPFWWKGVESPKKKKQKVYLNKI